MEVKGIHNILYNAQILTNMKKNNMNINHIYISYKFIFLKIITMLIKIIFLQSRYERQCWVGNPAHHNIFLHKNLHEDQKNSFVMDGRDEKGD
jgi:hypothetical protein